MNTLREMYPNGVYTENSQEVFDRFKELLRGDYGYDDESEYDGCGYVGLDSDCELVLIQYYFKSDYSDSVYLTNEEFMQITLEGSESVSTSTPTLSIGELVKQLQSSLSSSEVVIGFGEGKTTLACALKGDYCEWDVSDKTGDEIEALYNALSLIVGEG